MPRIKEGTEGESVQSVQLAIRILESLAVAPRGRGLTELANAMTTTKTRVLRHLRTLAALGYVTQDEENDRYRSGSALLALGQAAADNSDVVVAARPIMGRLRSELRHTVTLSLFRAESFAVVEVLLGDSPLKFALERGAQIQLHATAQGKVALAFGPDHLLEDLLAGPALAQRTPFTITDAAALRAAVARVREQGWADAAQQSVLRMNALAAPLLDHKRRFCGTLSVLDFVDEIPDPPATAQIAAVVGAARECSYALGYRP